jgi:molecular chaperone GrpE (heat shock protein)
MVEKYNDTEGASGLPDKRQFDESSLTKILVNAIKEQQAQIENLQKENQDYKSGYNSLKAELENIKSYIYSETKK